MLTNIPSRRRSSVSIEEVEDEDESMHGSQTSSDSEQSELWEALDGIMEVQEYPAGAAAGEVKREGKSPLVASYEAQMANQEEPWAPYRSYDEWEFVQWLINSGHTQESIEKLLKLRWVRR